MWVRGGIVYISSHPLEAQGGGAFDGAALPLPLVLDLDGTLLRTDLLLESCLRLVRRQPLALFLILVWALRGRAMLKHRLAERAEVAVDLLPISQALHDYAHAAAASGRAVIVATAANRRLAEQVCERFGFVSMLLSSDESVNLKGRTKAAALQARWPGGFAYAGDSAADFHVWRCASAGIFAGRDARLAARLQRTTQTEAIFLAPRASLAVWMRGLRLHQWVKNLLIFPPLLLAGHLTDLPAIAACMLAFVAMGLVASGSYLINDLMDLDEDRRHRTKRHRPLAAGLIRIGEGATAAVLLVTAGLVLAAVAGGIVAVLLLAAYCAVTLAYSFRLKRVPVLDVTVLAGLFTIRLVIGAAVAQVALSSWLAVFSMFLFLSLALAKRFTELSWVTAVNDQDGAMPGRGYVAADRAFVQALGVAAAAISVMILVFYLMEEAFPRQLYGLPQLLWSAPILIGLWLGRIWLLCGRGTLADDPVLFAVRDRTSIAIGGALVLSFGLAGLLG